LLHGLGFASSLQASGIARAEFYVGLLTFNLGVEIGQLMFVALVVGLAAAGHLAGMGQGRVGRSPRPRPIQWVCLACIGRCSERSDLSFARPISAVGAVRHRTASRFGSVIDHRSYGQTAAAVLLKVTLAGLPGTILKSWAVLSCTMFPSPNKVIHLAVLWWTLLKSDP
jgi:hypothetical protein